MSRALRVRHVNLRLDPQFSAVHSCPLPPHTHTSAQVQETEGPGSLKASLVKSVSSRLSERVYLKTYRRKQRGRLSINLWPPHTCTQMSACIYTHVMHACTCLQGPSWSPGSREPWTIYHTSRSIKLKAILAGRRLWKWVAWSVPTPKQQTHGDSSPLPACTLLLCHSLATPNL